MYAPGSRRPWLPATAASLERLVSRLRFGLGRRRQAERSFVTCEGKTDGVGAQAQAILSTLLLAHDLGLQYAHTPFRRIAHNDEGLADWVERWEEFFAFGDGEPSRAEVEALGLEVREVPSAWWIQPRDDTLWVVPHCHAYADAHVGGYTAIRDTARAKLHRHPKDFRSHRCPVRLTVAVHIRRGDVDTTPGQVGRFTTNRFAATVLDNLGEVLRREGLPAVVNVYSQGTPDDFPELKERDVAFHLDDSVFETFYNLIEADLLVTAKSSLSYAAALLSEGACLYEPFWHPPVPAWVGIRRDGSFDARKLLHRLRERRRNGESPPRFSSE